MGFAVGVGMVSGGTGGGAGNPVKEGVVSGNTLTLTLDDNTTVDVDVSTTSNELIIDDDSVATTKFYNLTISNDHQIRTQNSITVENN